MSRVADVGKVLEMLSCGKVLNQWDMCENCARLSKAMNMQK